MSTLAILGGAPVRTRPWPTWPQWGDKEASALQDVLASGEWGGFNESVAEFERAFGELHQARFCHAATNGTLSLEAALRVLEIGPGDEVIVPPYTFIATANAVRLVGATPVFVDVEPDTYNLDVTLVESALSSSTRAIIPVHFAGHAVDMDALLAIAAQHSIAIIEDAAHAHGASWTGKPLGALGDIGSFSFQQSKNLTAGEGGMLVTNSQQHSTRLWSYINQGRSPDGAWYEHSELGSNLRMTGLQAAILQVQLTRLEEQTTQRMASARHLIEILDEIEGPRPMRWDDRADKHAFHLFMMRYDTDDFLGLPRDKFVAALQAEGIPCSTGYARPLHHQPPLDDRYSRVLPCPVAERACTESIWLTQNLLLAPADEMDDIAHAMVKIREHAETLKSAT